MHTRSQAWCWWAVGVLLILLGAYISLQDWNKKREGLTNAQKNALGGALEGLTKLADALRNYPRGQQLIVWGIVITILGGIVGGVSGLK
jgi:predicted PurR-regulated permease PerM